MKKKELLPVEYVKLLGEVMSEISLIRLRLANLTKVTDKVILGGKTLEQAKAEAKGGD